jgi:hypothetical protein
VRPLAIIALLLCCGCGSYRDDLYKICNAHSLSGAAPGSGLAGVAPWLVDNLKTEKGRQLIRDVAQYGSVEQAREDAKANGITPCPMFDTPPAQVP